MSTMMLQNKKVRNIMWKVRYPEAQTVGEKPIIMREQSPAASVTNAVSVARVFPISRPMLQSTQVQIPINRRSRSGEKEYDALDTK